MANRKQRRKLKENINDEYTQNMKTTIITILSVLIIFGLFYLLTVAINNKNRKLDTKEPETEEATI